MRDIALRKLVVGAQLAQVFGQAVGEIFFHHEGVKMKNRVREAITNICTGF